MQAHTRAGASARTKRERTSVRSLWISLPLDPCRVPHVSTHLPARRLAIVALFTCLALEGPVAELSTAQLSRGLEYYRSAGGVGDTSSLDNALESTSLDTKSHVPRNPLSYAVDMLVDRPETGALAICAILALLYVLVPKRLQSLGGSGAATDVRSQALHRSSQMHTVVITAPVDAEEMNAAASSPVRRNNQVVKSEGVPTLPQALAGVLHPTLRRTQRLGKVRKDGTAPELETVLVGIADVANSQSPCRRRLLEAFNPLNWVFAAAGLGIERPQVTAAEYARGMPICVHLLAEGTCLGPHACATRAYARVHACASACRYCSGVRAMQRLRAQQVARPAPAPMRCVRAHRLGRVRMRTLCF